MRICNLFGAPGSSKSTSAAALFYLCKSAQIKVELVTEYAKQLTYAERQNTLKDQLYILAKQNAKLEILKDKGLDWVITDSPLLLSLVYTPKNYMPSFPKLILETFHRYDNVNFLLKRAKPYATYGRSQTEGESDQLGVTIKWVLDKNKIPYHELPGDSKAAQIIFQHITGAEPPAIDKGIASIITA